MRETLKKVFNISCLLGLHDNVAVATMSTGEIEELVRQQMVDRGVNAWIVNSMPWPGKFTKKLHDSKVCVCCGKFTNDIKKFSFKRSKLYYTLLDKHTKAVLMYTKEHEQDLKDISDAIQKQKEAENKGVWDLEDK